MYHLSEVFILYEAYNIALNIKLERHITLNIGVASLRRTCYFNEVSNTCSRFSANKLNIENNAIDFFLILTLPY